MQTINEQWSDYKENSLPFGTSDNTVKLHRCSFYVGSLSVLTILRELQGKTPEQINKRINSMFNEMADFKRELNE